MTMNPQPLLSTFLATTALTFGLSAPAAALTLSASASAASLQPATVAPSLDLQNGDFLIHANTQALPPHVTGDGVDETTTWAFDYSSQPGYAAFLASGPLVSAVLTLRLNTAFFIGGVGPITDIAFPSDGVASVGPGWLIPNFMTGTAGTYQLGSISTDLIVNVGTDPGELRNWLISNGGRIPMLYADDAIVVGAALQLTTAAVPEPAPWALAAAGLLALAALRARAHARSRSRSRSCAQHA
jgi:hypothetical protein